SLFTARFTGTFDGQTKKLHIHPLPVIHYQSTNTKMGVDCMMSGDFTLVNSRTESLLSGSFTSDAAHRYTVPDLNFRFRFSTDTMLVAVETGLEPADTTSFANTVKKDTPVIVRQEFLARPKTYFRDLEIHAPSIRIEVYDNGIVDNDIIS
ncbi:hypothetical protein LZ318_01630, partial [Saccharopolyspora indica]